MKLHSMKLSSREQESKPMAVTADRPEYPWGLGLTLDNEVLEKLGIDLPEVGSTLRIEGRVTVTAAQLSETQHSGRQRSASLQIVDLGVGPDERDDAAADRLYDK